uniref:Palmitoyltransferase n=1 Tax=Brugia malayi TaxID=6279 RepID=A0A1I9G2L2_BRUMA|nr:BMA-DHHC-1, isoform d [Brugia malayi]
MYNVKFCILSNFHVLSRDVIFMMLLYHLKCCPINETTEYHLIDSLLHLLVYFTGRLREILPSETQDRIAMFILFILLPLGFLFEIFAILPTEHEVMSKGWNLRVGILMLFGLNAFANVYKVISVGPNGNCSDLPAVQKHGYRFCYNCQLNEPPRSHHCPVCDRCVFRRDHHSSFVAVCVGHFNQRYYISAICSLWIISLTVLMWNWSFMWTSLGGFSPLQLWELIVPHLALIFRIISFSQFLCVMTFIFSFTVFVFLCYLITAQLFCLYRGQTRMEYLMDVHAYNLGFMENVRQAMGRRWFIALLMPFISSPLDSDGLSYPTRESKPLNDMKTMHRSKRGMNQSSLSLEDVDYRFNKCLRKAMNDMRQLVKGEISEDELANQIALSILAYPISSIQSLKILIFAYDMIEFSMRTMIAYDEKKFIGNNNDKHGEREREREREREVKRQKNSNMIEKKKK